MKRKEIWTSPGAEVKATGAVDDVFTRWGWDAIVQTRDRELSDYQVFDTLEEGAEHAVELANQA